MGGTAKLCDADLLKVGASCIIVVDRVNSPTGTWSGRVTTAEVCDGYVRVQAVITGTFEGAPYTAVGYSTGERTPSVNYRVYPDTPTIRHLFEGVLHARAKIRALEERLGLQKQEHHELIEHLVRTGALRTESSK